MAKIDRKASPKISPKCTLLRETSRKRQKDVTTDSDSVVTVGVVHTSSLRTTSAPASVHEEKEQAVALEKGTVGSETHAVAMEMS